jgi:histidinol dehydrogenase
VFVVNRLDSSTEGFDEALRKLLDGDSSRSKEVERIVAGVLSDVRDRGDAAVLDYTERFDGVTAHEVAELQVSDQTLAACFQNLPENDRTELIAAATRIRKYHERQLECSTGFMFEDDLGNRLGQRVLPLERVGVYVPGGQAAYPSTVLMTVIPARVSGVDQVVVTVSTPNGFRNDHVMAALHLAGVDEVFALGGAQAVGALAFGTETLAKVDKVVGPGGEFVAAAKRQVYGQVGVDTIAGPSEILIVADGSVPTRWTALDLLSQAEHDAAARVILASPDAAYLEAVVEEVTALLPQMGRRKIIEASLGASGALIKTRDLSDAVAIANRIAPEHLQLAVADARGLLSEVQHAGAIFLGGYSAEAIGDYAAGPSHVLPTSGAARYASVLGVYDFQKRSSIIDISAVGANKLGRTAATIANAEGLEAHARAALARIDRSSLNESG